MKKGTYYITIRGTDKIWTEEVKGYIIPDEKSGLAFGARYRAGKGWEITETSTGLLIHYAKTKICNKDAIMLYIDKMRDAVVKQVNSKSYDTLKDAITKAKENSTQTV